MPPMSTSPFRTVLVPLDGSPLSRAALPIAAAATSPADGALYLAQVHEPVLAGGPIVGTEPLLDYDADADARLAEADALRSLADDVKGRTRLAVHWALLDDGPVAPVLRDHASDLGADLVVMTTHGRSGVSRAVLGSVATALVASAHVPVLVVRPHAPTDAAPPAFVRRILVLLDGSALSEGILEPALRLAAPAQATLALARIAVPTPIPMAPGPAPLVMVDPEEFEREVIQAGAYLERVAGPLRARGVTVTTHVERGASVASAVGDLATRERVDAIAMATHARRGVARALLGSVAEEVVRAGGKPVLLFRPAEG